MPRVGNRAIATIRNQSRIVKYSSTQKKKKRKEKKKTSLSKSKTSSSCNLTEETTHLGLIFAFVFAVPFLLRFRIVGFFSFKTFGFSDYNFGIQIYCWASL
ncbi:hypothetical protein Csa_015186 [Cucumis sativus]|uniref:Uncharacterized protein n=1 Tax=Cucumis sativus TaxID=3659 RepID=A0A0A0KXX7_CUCSA|nr:hypothetical protein Csa_015186 [Cucumis sativus]